MKAFVTATLALVLVASVTASADPCRYAIHRPDAVARGLRHALPDLGIASLSPEFRLAEIPLGREALLRGPAIVGQSSYAEDVRRGVKELTVFDARGGILFRIIETKYVCPSGQPAGLCRQIQAYTDLQRVQGELYPFVITMGPLNELPHYFRYAAPVDYATFEHDFAEATDWLKRTLVGTPLLVEPTRVTPEQRVFWALAGDPLIAPYLARLTLRMGKQYFVIRGVVPSNEIYGLIIDRAREAGFFAVDPQMIIDTRTRLPPLPPAVPEGCWP